MTPDRSEREALHAAAYLDIAVPLLDWSDRPLGPRVVALTPYHLALLSLYASPVLTGGPCSRRQLMQALWLMSEDFRLGSRLRFNLFCLRWWPHSLSPLWRCMAAGALRRWHKLQFISAPEKEVKKDGVEVDPGEHWLAVGITGFARVLGWRESEVLHTPYARMFEYLSGREGNCPDRPRFNGDRDAQAKRYLLSKKNRLATSTP